MMKRWIALLAALALLAAATSALANTPAISNDEAIESVDALKLTFGELDVSSDKPDALADENISVVGFLNRADSFRIVLAEEPADGSQIQVNVDGLPTRSFEAKKGQKEYSWDNFFDTWSGGPTLIEPDALLKVRYIDRFGNDRFGFAYAGRSSAQRDIMFIVTPSMRRSMGKLTDMDLKLQGYAVNYEQIKLTVNDGATYITASGEPPYWHTKMGKWGTMLSVVPELSLSERGFAVEGSYVNIDGGGLSNTIMYRGLYHPLVVTSPIVAMDNAIYGFMDPEATIFIDIEHTDALHEAFDSTTDAELFELGVSGTEITNGIGYFLFNYDGRFAPGDIVRVWYVGADGIADDYVYEHVVQDLIDYSDETPAEALGASITEWTESEGPRQAFVLPVKLSDIAENPGDYTGLPMIAFGGYDVGSFSVALEGGKLTVTEMSVDYDVMQGNGSIRCFTEMPAIDQLSSGGSDVSVGQAFSVPKDTDIVWIYANVPVRLDMYTIASHETGVTFSGQADASISVSEENSEWYRRFNRFQGMIDEASENGRLWEQDSSGKRMYYNKR